MLYFVKELKFVDGWRYWGSGRTRSDLLATLIQKNSDKLERRFSPSTQVEIEFHDPHDHIRTSRVDELIQIRKVLGERVFDDIIGWWPWGDITSFRDEEEILFLKNNHGIVDARLISWRA